jgi:hypothetical protein
MSFGVGGYPSLQLPLLMIRLISGRRQKQYDKTGETFISQWLAKVLAA